MIFDLPPAPVLWTLAAVFAVLAAASLATAWLYRRDAARHGELVLRVKSWWLMIGIFSLALVLSRTAALVLFGFVSFIAFKEYLSLIPTRRAIWSQWTGSAAVLDEDGYAAVRVRFEIDRTGRLAAAPTVVDASGNILFDQAGIRAVMRATTFFPLPVSYADATLGVRFHFVYGDEE